MLEPQHELIYLGMSPRLVGYWDILAAIEIVAMDKCALMAMVQDIYTPVAARRHVEWGCVEASIRKAIKSIWRRGDRRRLERIMHRQLPEPPTTGEFLGAFVFYLEGAGEDYEALLH